MRNELALVINEEDITLVVIGKPAGDSSVFELSELESFAPELEQETDVKTVLV